MKMPNRPQAPWPASTQPTGSSDESNRLHSECGSTCPAGYLPSLRPPIRRPSKYGETLRVLLLTACHVCTPSTWYRPTALPDKKVLLPAGSPPQTGLPVDRSIPAEADRQHSVFPVRPARRSAPACCCPTDGQAGGRPYHGLPARKASAGSGRVKKRYGYQRTYKCKVKAGL